MISSTVSPVPEVTSCSRYHSVPAGSAVEKTTTTDTSTFAIMLKTTVDAEDYAIKITITSKDISGGTNDGQRAFQTQ